MSEIGTDLAPEWHHDSDADLSADIADLVALDGTGADLTEAEIAGIDPSWDEDAEAADDIDIARFADDDADDQAAGTGPAARPSHAHLRTQPEEDRDALERILSRTDAQMNAPETQERRSAITQLKAAVAATEAARRMGEDADDEDEEHENAFRDDLRQAVRPRRPVASHDGRSERPRPAPLKLVASQRIDLPHEEEHAAVPAMPVRPRRVSVAADAPAATAAAASQAHSFAEFAEEMGATSLADLLEAAAAYTSFVEGIEDFSRPQLMKKLSTVTAEPFNREDTLRSFGTLLREGRITRSAAAGRFQVSEGTRFHPERRAG